MVMLLTPGFAFSQSDASEYFQGFAEAISGKGYTYHSPFPDVTSSLIMRGRADFEPIRWRTEVVPESYTGETVTFIWVYSMDTDPEPVPFILRVNGTEWFRFSSPRNSQIGTWSVEGKGGAKLSFRVTMLDRFEDEMGFAILKLPSSAIEPGQAAELEISAEAVEDNSWFMTYKTGIKEQAKIYQNQVVVKDVDQLLHSLSVDMIHLGDDARCSIHIGDQTTETWLQAGYNPVEIFLPKVDQPTEFKAIIRVEGARYPGKDIHPVARERMGSVPGAAYPFRYWLYPTADRNPGRASALHRSCPGLLRPDRSLSRGFPVQVDL
jgi:hypothetical protein